MSQLSLPLAIESPPQTKKSDCWQTPPDLLEIICLSFAAGKIITDPCSTSENPTRAQIFYTPVENGLIHPWKTNAFINPPYSDPSPWIEATNERIARGEIEEAIALLPVGCLGSKRSGEPARNAQAFCLWCGRIAFINPITAKMQTGTNFTSAFLYWGPFPRQFQKVFDRFGIVGIC